MEEENRVVSSLDLPPGFTTFLKNEWGIERLHPPQAAASDGVGLAQWLAKLLEVQDMVFVGYEFLDKADFGGRAQAIGPSLLQGLK